MRSYDRYRKYNKKNTQSEDKKDDLIWDFQINNKDPILKFPVYLSDAVGENEKQRFERYIRQLGRAILSCSLCERGINFFISTKNDIRDPHFQPSIVHNDIAIIKYEPDDNDIYDLIEKDLYKKLYVTSIIKCYGKKECQCPYFNLEIKALSKCWPKLWIILDEKCADYFNIKWKIGKFQTLNDCKFYCCNFKDKYYNKIIKMIQSSNP